MLQKLQVDKYLAFQILGLEPHHASFESMDPEKVGNLVSWKSCAKR